MSNTDHRLVLAYLAQLEKELASASPLEREEMLAQVRAEFAARLDEIQDPTDRQVLAVSAKLGQPRQFVAEAGLAPAQQLQGTNWVLARAPIIAALAALVITLYSSLVAAILAGFALLLVLVSIPRWQALKNTIVVSAILVIVTGIVLAVQVLGATQTPA